MWILKFNKYLQYYYYFFKQLVSLYTTNLNIWWPSSLPPEMSLNIFCCFQEVYKSSVRLIQKYKNSLLVVRNTYDMNYDELLYINNSSIRQRHLHFPFIEASKSVNNLNSKFLGNFLNIKDIVPSPEHLICHGLSLLLLRDSQGSVWATGGETCNFIKRDSGTGVFLWILRNF